MIPAFLLASVLTAYADVLRAFNPGLSPRRSVALAQEVIVDSEEARIDPRLVVALVASESTWHLRAVSPAGALGLGQLMPGTAAGLHVDPLEPTENIRGTVGYLASLIARYRRFGVQQRFERAIAAYNAGPGAVERYDGIPPYRETQRYVRIVIARWLRLSRVE